MTAKYLTHSLIHSLNGPKQGNVMANYQDTDATQNHQKKPKPMLQLMVEKLNKSKP